MNIGKIRATLEDQVIHSLEQLSPQVRTSFQDRIRGFALSNRDLNDERAMTSYVGRACQAELRRGGLAREERQNLRRLMSNTQQLLQLPQ